jgi:hypothetical protein
MPTEKKDKEIEYGKWQEHTPEETAAELNTMPPVVGDIWPNWNDGVPTKLRRQLGSPFFTLGKVSHKNRTYYDKPLVFEWSQSFTLSELSKNKYLLPEHDSGVYRLFAPNKTIGRCCGKDPTGTLYLGRAGTKRNWSNLHTRIKLLANGDHHVINTVVWNEMIQKMYPWRSLAVQWAYMGKRTDYKGDSVPAAILGEIWLLACYHDTFGEHPPWNQKGWT